MAQILNLLNLKIGIFFKSILIGRAKELNRVSYRWGENQKIELEHEIAGMRKQLGQLWELCAEDPNQPKVQKVRVETNTIDFFRE